MFYTRLPETTSPSFSCLKGQSNSIFSIELFKIIMAAWLPIYSQTEGFLLVNEVQSCMILSLWRQPIFWRQSYWLLYIITMWYFTFTLPIWQLQFIYFPIITRLHHFQQNHEREGNSSCCVKRSHTCRRVKHTGAIGNVYTFFKCDVSRPKLSLSNSLIQTLFVIFCDDYKTLTQTPKWKWRFPAVL